MDVIRLVDVSKRFSRLQGPKLLANWGFWRRGADGPGWFYALEGIDLAISKRGLRIGVIGANGSGKTTLLRLIAGVTLPTSGTLLVNGTVVSLLELFAGMQPELTGRENIWLNGALLGMRRGVIRHKFDSIVDFSGVSEFLDMPLKHYSLGMMMRLGFSVASHVDADIVLADEIWGIGDAEFQAKCSRRLKELNRNGVTLVLVSHDLNVLRGLTDEIAWLQSGRVAAFGPSTEVIERYLNFVQTDSKSSATSSHPRG